MLTATEAQDLLLCRQRTGWILQRAQRTNEPALIFCSAKAKKCELGSCLCCCVLVLLYKQSRKSAAGAAVRFAAVGSNE